MRRPSTFFLLDNILEVSSRARGWFKLSVCFVDFLFDPLLCGFAGKLCAVDCVRIFKYAASYG